MAALIFILISLTAAVFHGASPVRADDVAKPDPIAIDGDTATVDVRLYTDEHHTQKLEDPVTSTSTLYGAFSAQFKGGKAPTPEKNIAVYKLPDTIVVDDNDGGDLMEGPEATAAKAGTWKIKDNKVIFAFDKNWLASNPAEIYVGANFSFELACICACTCNNKFWFTFLCNSFHFIIIYKSFVINAVRNDIKI